MLIGILAAQGAYKKHKDILNTINVDSVYVKNVKQLSVCDALILPGGESTAISNIIQANNLYESIKSFASNSYVFGTCAGMILMGSNKSTQLLKPLKLFDIKVSRNAYGSQVDSFIDNISLSFDRNKFSGVFIRAPKVISRANDIEVLSVYNDSPVLIRKDRFLASSFHPELTSDNRVHKYFVNMVQHGN